MTKYRYVGVADVLSFSEEDFSRHQIDGQGEVSFDQSNNWTAELTDESAQYLKMQGFPLMTEDEYNSFLEDEREKARAVAAEEVAPEVVPPPPGAADLVAPAGPPSIPDRPGSDATRDELASFAWEHYSIPADSAEKNMTKAEINKALDKAEKDRQAEIDAFESESTVGDEPSGQPVNEGVATGNVNTT